MVGHSEAICRSLFSSCYQLRRQNITHHKLKHRLQFGSRFSRNAPAFTSIVVPTLALFHLNNRRSLSPFSLC